MTYREFAGSVLAYTYNAFVGKLPCHWLRSLYLAPYLGCLGENTTVQMNCRFLHARNVHLGSNTVLNFGCLLDGRRHTITIGDNVSIGPEAAILTLGHDPQSSTFADEGGAVVIGDRAWIAYGATILPGITVGEGAVVAAGAVVTRNVEPYTIVAGAPARKVGDRTKDLKYGLKYKPFLL